MKIRFPFYFFLTSIFAYVAIGCFSRQLPFWEMAVLVVRKHDLPSLVLSGLPNNVYEVYRHLPELAAFLDSHILFFPSFLKIWLWSPVLIYLFFSLPLVSLLAFFFSCRFARKIKLLVLAVLILYFVPVVNLAGQGMDKLAIDSGFDWRTPFSKEYVWIWSSDDRSVPYARFIYTWNQKRSPTLAKVKLSCLGHYQLLVNSKSVYHGPSFAVYPWVYYDQIDIQGYLNTGKNTIEVICEFIKELVHEYNHYQAPALLMGGYIKDGLTGHNLADYRLWYSGRASIRNTKRLSADAGYAHEINLNSAERRMSVSKRLDRRQIKALPRPLPLLRFEPVSYQKKKGNIYDLGRLMPVYLSVKTNQPKACRAKFIWLGDFLDLRQVVPYFEQEDVVIFPGGASVWHQFSRRTGRGVAVQSDCSGKLNLSFKLAGMPVKKPSVPNTLSPLDKRIYQISLNALKNGTQDHFEDSLVRERAMYLGDALAVSRCLLVDRENAWFVKEMINIFAQAQGGNGSLPAMASSGKEMLIPDYVFAWPVLLEEYLRASEDKKFANEMYPKLMNLLDWADDNSSPEGFIYNKHELDWWLFIDWTPIDKSLRFSTPLQLWYLRALRSAGYVANFTGRDSSEFRLRASNLRARLVEYAFDDGEGLFVDSFDVDRRSENKSLITNSLAGGLSLFPEGYSSQAVKVFGEKLYTISPFSQRWVVEWLIKEGKSKLALEVLRHYWGRMVEKGHTSVHETYDPVGIQPEKGSHSHAWGCGPIYLYPKIYKALGAIAD